MKKKKSLTKVKKRPVKKKVVKKKVAKKTKRITTTKKKSSALKQKSKVSKKPIVEKPKTSSSTTLPAGVSLEEVGVVTHYFPHVEAAVVKLTKGTLNVGDSIIIKGHTTDFKDTVTSMQLDHVPITSAAAGQEIGLKVKSKVREHDIVYKVIS